jgi:hypothetical protein
VVSVRCACHRVIVLAVLPLLALSAGSAHARAGARPLRVTFVGDSVPAALDYVSTAEARLARGMSLRLNLKVCRRLVQTGCSFQGSAPTTALQAIESYGSSLGDVLIVDVGYNESSHGYGSHIDEIMHAALRQGVHGVVWVTLRESSRSRYASIYHTTNAQIEAARRRWPQLVVADWNGFSEGKPWFGPDGLHLTSTGALALATFLRPFVFKAA